MNFFLRIRYYTAIVAVCHTPNAIAGVSMTYLMAAHTCDTSAGPTGYCSDPTYHSTQILESNDGVSWTPIPGFPAAWSGSVPDLIVRNSTIYIYNPGTVRRINKGSGSLLSTGSVRITDSSGKPISFVDPCPVLDTATNKIVLFYLDSTGVSGDPGGCNGTYPCTKYIRSATEQDSRGRIFVQDPGDRVAITISSVTDSVGIIASDPDVFPDASGYVMLVSRGGKTQAFTSSALTGSYSAIAALSDSVLIDGLSGVSAGYYDSTSTLYWIYTHDSSTTSVIREATASSLTSVLRNSDFTTIATALVVGLNPLNYLIASPGFTKVAP